MCEDRVIGRSGMPAKSAVAKSLSAIGRAGIDDDGFRAGTPKLRLEDMDRDGLWASVIYGPLSLGFPIDDPALQNACFAAWNDWAVEEFNAVAPDRLCVLAFLPGHSPEAAAAELERCAARGHRGAIIGVFDIDVGDPAWDRLWAAARAHRPADQLPHQGRHVVEAQLPDRQVAVGRVRDAAAAAARRAAGHHGVLRRARAASRPQARAGGVGRRLAAVLPRAHGPRVGRACATSSTTRPRSPPSELFRRQVIATFEEDALGAQLIPLLGADSCMWASDYPHTDSTFPNSQQAIEETLGTLPAADRRKITATNCARLYGFAA